MKSTWKKLLSIIMVLCMLVTIVPVTVLAVDAEPVGDDADIVAAAPLSDTEGAEAFPKDAQWSSVEGGTWQNPLYPDLGKPAVKYNAGEMIQGNLIPEDFKSRDYVPQVLRQALVERKSEIYLYYSALTPVTEEECLSIMEDALAETGVYNEGDYLMNSILEYGYAADYMLDGITYYNVVVYAVSYLTDAQQEEVVYQRANELRDSLFEDGMADSAKHKALYDYISTNVEYDLENAGNIDYLRQHTAYGALVDGKASAQGYAMLYYYLSNFCGLPCRIVIGTAGGTDVLFMWNIVQNKSMWYNMDIAADAYEDTYNYFMKGSEDFTDHVRLEYYETAEFHAAHPMAPVAYMPEQAAYGDVGGLHWNYNELTNELVISGSGEMPDFETVYYSGGESFQSCSAPWWSVLNYTAVIIEEGVTSIGKNAFHRASVASVSLPKSLTAIEEMAFYTCEALTAIEFPENLAVIGNEAFRNCYNLKGIALPKALTTIGDFAFANCPITEVTLPENVSFVGRMAFLHNDMTLAFNGYLVDDANPYFTVENGLLLSKDKTILAAVPQGVKEDAFVYPATVTTIGRGAFTACTDWTSVEIPEQITRIEGYAFEGLTVEQLDIPDTVTYIGEGAFANMTNLRGIALPDGITEIADGLFRGTPLHNLIIPDGVTTIGENAFADCKVTVSIYVPLSVKTVEANAFQNCFYLNYVYYEGTGDQWKQITIAEGNEFLGRWGQFYSERKITGTAQGGNNKIDKMCWTLDLASGELLIYDEIHTYGNTKAGDYGWHPYRDRITSVRMTWANTTTRFIGLYMFADCVNLKNVIFEPNANVWSTDINPEAFAGCTSLETITIPANTTMTTYGDGYGGVFKNCTSLKTVIFEGNDMVYWPANLFEGCTSLKSFTIPASAVQLGEGMFKGCTALESVHFAGNGITVLPANVFAGCTSLKEQTIPASVTEIGDNAFAGCDNLTQVNYKGVENQWNQMMIGAGNEALTNAEISFGVCDAHIWDSGTVTKEPTLEEEGEKLLTCTICGQTKTESISKLPDPSYVNPFTDVSDADYFYAPVQWAVQNNVTGGVGVGLFGPHNGCTRGQVVTFLWAAAGRPEPASLNNPFNDVSESDYFFKPVLWAVENGITGGIGEGLFGPNETCTRGQIVTFLWASQGKPAVSGSSTFYDVADTDWYAKPVIWAAQNGVTGGMGDGGFGPNNTCTRGQVVTFLYKVYG